MLWLCYLVGSPRVARGRGRSVKRLMWKHLDG
ncbi:MAG: hypothetical protein JWN63_2290 [Candidatus Acidoferrum typicum]|nr:hypothetical protein [Candidatus Acidoferrum typicum]